MGFFCFLSAFLSDPPHGLVGFVHFTRSAVLAYVRSICLIYNFQFDWEGKAFLGRV